MFSLSLLENIQVLRYQVRGKCLWVFVCAGSSAAGGGSNTCASLQSDKSIPPNFFGEKKICKHASFCAEHSMT